MWQPDTAMAGADAGWLAARFGDRALVGEALLRLAWARFLIRFVPVRHWRALMGPVGKGAGAAMPDAGARLLAARIGRCVARGAWRAPFQAVCLPQAMAARWMLARRGIATDLYIGARSRAEAPAPVDLHAWLMLGDLCVTGAAERESYAAFTAAKTAQTREAR